MKTFDKQAAQGDLLITKIDKLPAKVKKAESDGGKFILAHSETGHHHTVLEQPVVRMQTQTNTQ